MSSLERIRRLNQAHRRLSQRSRSSAQIDPEGRAKIAEVGSPAPHYVSLGADADPGLALEELVPGEEISTPHGSCFLHVDRYPTDRRRGPLTLGACQSREVRLLARLYPQGRLEAFDFGNAAFLDTETSGLHGAGVFAFMVGVGAFEADEFVVRQFFMRHPGEEAALVHAVQELLASCSSVVTFNGWSFDVPLLTHRFRIYRTALNLAEAPHLDLLPPARRIWSGRIASCALSALERDVLHVWRDVDDVPGWAIPGLYQNYLEHGWSQPMPRIFYHNQEDILTLAGLAGYLAWLYQSPDTHPQAVPGDSLRLARIYAETGHQVEAESAYRTALHAPLSQADRAQAYRGLSLLLKRAERREEAAALWEEWIAEAADNDLTPYIELAKHHEWRTGDLAAALDWTQRALQLAESGRAASHRLLMLAELAHRLTRLERKLAESVE